MAARRPRQPRSAPRSYTAWIREQDGLRRFLASLDGYLPAYGQRWVDKMRAHYTARLAALEAMDPPPVRPGRR